MRWVARPLDFFVLKQAKPFKDPLNGFFFDEWISFCKSFYCDYLAVFV